MWISLWISLWISMISKNVSDFIQKIRMDIYMDIHMDIHGYQNEVLDILRNLNSGPLSISDLCKRGLGHCRGEMAPFLSLYYEKGYIKHFFILCVCIYLMSWHTLKNLLPFK